MSTLFIALPNLSIVTGHLPEWSYKAVKQTLKDSSVLSWDLGLRNLSIIEILNQYDTIPIFQSLTDISVHFKRYFKNFTCSRYVSMILHLLPCLHPESLTDISALPCLFCSLSLSLSLSLFLCCSLSSRQQLLLMFQDQTHLVQHPEPTGESEQLTARFRPGRLGSVT